MIHGKLQVFFQMFSQISRTPDFEQSFRLKRCGLYAGVYGNKFSRLYVFDGKMRHQEIIVWRWKHIDVLMKFTIFSFDFYFMSQMMAKNMHEKTKLSVQVYMKKVTCSASCGLEFFRFRKQNVNVFSYIF